MYVGYKNQTPLTIIGHLYNQWVKVTNADKVAALEAFNVSWADMPDSHIRTFGRELDKRQRRLRKMKVPCDDTTNVIPYVDQMNKIRVFKEEELLKWDNTPLLQGWVATKDHFTTTWIDCEAFKRRLADDRPFDSALALGTQACSGHMNSSRPGARVTAGGLTPSLRSEANMNLLVKALERSELENATLQDELDATTVVTAPLAKIIAAVTTSNNNTELIAQLTVQGTAQTSQINHLLTALSAGGGGH